MTAFAKHPKLAADLNTSDPDAVVNVIVKVRPGTHQTSLDRLKSHGAAHLAPLALH